MVLTRSGRTRSLSREIDEQSRKEGNDEELVEREVYRKEKVAPIEEEIPVNEGIEPDDNNEKNDNLDDSNEESISEEEKVLVPMGPTTGVRPVTKPGSKEKNALTKLIPGYTAPMKLNTSSLDQYRPIGGIGDLQRKAERTDASTKNFVLDATKKHTDAMQKNSSGLFPSTYTAAYSSFKKGKKRPVDNTAGKGWFRMTPTPMTDELKTDLAVIRNRTYLDPKRFYKSADKHHSIVQLGTVIEGAAEYYSSRLTKKQRRANLTEEIMADPETSDWAKKKFKKMSREKTIEAQKRIGKAKKVKRFF